MEQDNEGTSRSLGGNYKFSPGQSTDVDNEHLKRLSRWLRKVEGLGFSAQACWIWRGYRNAKGYGAIALPERRYAVPAHRVFYELLVEPFDSILHLDHLCRVRACVCPWHLVPVTRNENWRRARSAPDPLAIHRLWRERVDNVSMTVEGVIRYRISESSPQASAAVDTALPAETGVIHLSTSPSTSKDLVSKKNLERRATARSAGYGDPDALAEELLRERYGIS